MSALVQRRYGRGLSIILVLFTLIYTLGLIYLLLCWFGVQSFDPAVWQPNSLSLYIFVFLMGTGSLYEIWRGQKWGVYGLVGTWVLTGVLNFVFAPQIPIINQYTFLAVLLVVVFFLFLRPSWRNMD